MWKISSSIQYITISSCLTWNINSIRAWGFKSLCVAGSSENNVSRLPLSPGRAVTQVGLALPLSPSLYKLRMHLCVRAMSQGLWVTQNSPLASKDPVPLYLACLQDIFGEALASAQLIERRMYRQRALTAKLPRNTATTVAEEAESPGCHCCQRTTKKPHVKNHTYVKWS